MNEKQFEFAVDFLKTATGRATYGIVTSRGISKRISRPCYGEMRPYGVNSTRPQDQKPNDLRNDFPKSKPVGLAFKNPHASNRFWKQDAVEKTKKYIYWLWGEESPWLGPDFENLITPIEEEGVLKGFIVGTADFLPTRIVSLMMFTRNCASAHRWDLKEALEAEGLSSKAAGVASLFTGLDPHYGILSSVDGYCLSPNSNLRRLYNQDPLDLDEGGLWSDRTAYNRPDLARLFSDGEFIFNAYATRGKEIAALAEEINTILTKEF